MKNDKSKSENSRHVRSAKKLSGKQKQPSIVKRPLTAGSTSAVRFGSVGENAFIYLKEGVDNQISELQEAIAAKEAAKQAALESLEELEDLQSDCSMSDIRQRLNLTVGALQDLLVVL